MGIHEQARFGGSTLSRFVSDRLPDLGRVAEAWLAELGPAPGEGPLVPGGRDDVGWVFELCVGLDVAEAPPRARELSYLPIDRCRAVLVAAGFEHRRVGMLPLSGTTDPLLCH